MRNFCWEKKGLIFNPLLYERPYWSKEYALAPCTLILEDRLRVYFSCRPLKGFDNQQISYSTFIDLDKNDLTQIIYMSDKPICSLGVLGAFDEHGVVMTSVLNHQGQVYAYYIGWSRMQSVPYATAIGVLKSSNLGADFYRIGMGGPIVTSNLNSPMREHACPIVRCFENKFYMWHMAGIKWIIDPETGKKEPQYLITYSTSNNAIDWMPENHFIIPTLTEDECQTTPSVFFKDGIYHMFFSYRRALDFRENISRSYRIGYAFSADLKKWERNDSNAGIEISSDGWDSEMICYPHVFELNGKWYMFYNGNQFGRAGFGYAELKQ